MAVRAIVLAAGKGTRMRSDAPKVLQRVAGRPIVSWVVDAVSGAGADEITVVVGHGADDVVGVLPDGVKAVVQEQQLGTGHATIVAYESLGGVEGDAVLIVPGDSPLFLAETLGRLVDAHAAGDAPCTLLTTRMPDPTGYGRVVRKDGGIVGIVEESDADDATLALDEVSVSTYVFDGAALGDALGRLDDDNHQGEYYLTDVVGMLAAGSSVGAVVTHHEETLGVNSHDQLAAADAVMRRRINADWMQKGVWMQDPERVYVDATATLEPGARIYPGVHIEGTSTVGADAQIGPDTFLLDSAVGRGSRVWYSVLRGARVDEGVDVGPYASLRPGTVLHQGSKAGTFVEVKASEVGKGSKVPHLSYIGDATIGEDSNIGAGTITCNYDGFQKHRTVIGSRVFVGSDTMLVAPVELGDGSFTGAGSVISKDVGPGALGVERSPQKEIPGYADRRARKVDEKGEEH
ncbi:MAG TPA: bifunctional UDP-N-acetylglucosamine diphosphorylase/glucosamine-1-phosphate N-acetyltransferase GlmU [Acidimicrobiia bacterium]|nr:bifunctional UDP-N-acetylglucosamine diphosphorylase/glucosamine-1-phosphate N-acetyltransferase GlmU [Acidimicrobiia bacterium]